MGGNIDICIRYYDDNFGSFLLILFGKVEESRDFDFIRFSEFDSIIN